MMLKNEKDLQSFIDNRERYISTLFEELRTNGIEGKSFKDYSGKISKIQHFYEEKFLKYDVEMQNQLRLAFWAFFSKLLMEKLGGVLQIAPKNDYCEGTPQLIDYGNRYDRKGKKKWIGIGFDSWLNTHVKGLNNFSLQEKVSSLIEDYS